MQYIQTTRGPIAYHEAGQGLALLFVHGWGGSARYWAQAHHEFADQYRVITLDLPGFGASPAHTSAMFDDLAASVLAFTDALGVERFALVGHSLGASVALLIASTVPDQVTQLGLVSFGLTTSPVEQVIAGQIGAQYDRVAQLWGPWLTLARPWFALTRPNRQIAALTPPLPVLLAAPYIHHWPPPLNLAFGALDFAGMDPLSALESAASIGDLRFTSIAPHASMPTLVLGGRQDRIFPPINQRALASVLPNAQITLLDDCGHVPMVERPQQCYQALRTFLTA